MRKLTGIIVALATVVALTLSASALTIFESRYISGVEFKIVTDITRYEQKYQDENKFLDTDINNLVKIYDADDLWLNLRKDNSVEVAAQMSTSYYMAKDGSFGKTKVTINDGDVKVFYDGFADSGTTDEVFKSIFTANEYTDADGNKRVINDLFYFEGKNKEAIIAYYTPNGVFTDVYPEGLNSSKVLKSLSEEQIKYLAAFGKKNMDENKETDFYAFMKADGYSVPEHPEEVSFIPDETSNQTQDGTPDSNAYYDTPDNSAMLAIYMMIFFIGIAGMVTVFVLIRDKKRDSKSSKIMKK